MSANNQHITLLPNRSSGRLIGLMGGSFNPAHDGHRHISLVALKRLGLHEIWWLVTPQNPLKEKQSAPGLSERMTQAQQIAHHPKIRVTDIEKKLGTTYTVDTVRMLTTKNSNNHFVWIMGADNFTQLPLWKNWNDLMHLIPMAIVGRPGHQIKAGLAKAAQAYSRDRVDPRYASLLPYCEAPAWTLIVDKLVPTSSTEIRANRGK